MNTERITDIFLVTLLIIAITAVALSLLIMVYAAATAQTKRTILHPAIGGPIPTYTPGPSQTSTATNTPRPSSTPIRDTPSPTAAPSSTPMGDIVICHMPGTPAENTLIIPDADWAGHVAHGEIRDWKNRTCEDGPVASSTPGDGPK